ncbi:MAG: RimK family alpha-L-glutamate ligase [Spongiibacteraceae bacterium]
MSEHEINTLYNIHSSTAKGLKIGVLASNPDLYSNRRLMEVGAERGHEMVFLNIRQCYLRMDTDSPEVFYRGGRVLNDLDVIIPRIRSDLTFYGCALVRHFESLGVFVLNASAAISQCRDALFSLQVLQQNGLDLPVSGFANMPIDTNELIDLVGGAPLIVKALNTGQGLLQEQLVAATVLAHTREEAQNVINAIKVEGGSVNLLVQAFVAEADGKDLRCLVLDGKVVAAIQRTAVEGKLDTRVENGGKASAIQITPEEQRLAIKAARTLGLKIAGVDIIRSNKGPLLLKVNASPGLEGIESVTKKDVASAIIDTVEKKLQRLKKSAKL